MLILYIYQEMQVKENIKKTGYSILNSLVTDTRHSLQKGERNSFQMVLDKIKSLENVQSVSLYTPDKLMTYKSNEMTVGLPFLKQNGKLVNPNEDLYVQSNGSFIRDDWSFSQNSMEEHAELVKAYKGFENNKAKKCSSCHFVLEKNLNFDATRKAHTIKKEESNFYYDIPIERSCVSCHSHWKVGQSAGYLGINMSNEQITSQSNNRLKYFLTILLVVIVSFLVIGYFIKALNKKLQSTQSKLKDQVNHDSMTGLFNRRYLYEISSDIIKECKESNSEIYLLMFDIDNFKKINDTHGHDIGDKVIISLAKEVLRCTRKSDVVARWGGEEFLIILPDTSKKGAQILAEKIRANIAALHVKKIKFTVSIGLTSFYCSKDKSIDDTIKRADDALYEAKETGKNKVCYM